MHRSAMILATLTFAAAPLAAQDHKPMHAAPAQHQMSCCSGSGDQMEAMMAPMMEAMSSAPGHLLSMKDRLHLTADQQTRLTAIDNATKAARDSAASQGAMHMREMVSAMHAASADTNAVRTHFNAAIRFMSAAHWAEVKAATQAWPVLTAAQQQQLGAMRDSVMGGMHGMRH